MSKTRIHQDKARYFREGITTERLKAHWHRRDVERGKFKTIRLNKIIDSLNKAE